MDNKSLSLIHKKGHRITRQRRLILSIIEESDEHLNVQAIYRIARERDQNISLATVYRSLELLKEINLVQEHSLGEDHGHFEKCDPKSHFHFTCSTCGAVIEFQIPPLSSWMETLAESKNLKIDEIHLFITGACKDCWIPTEIADP